mmetsp:Transcript_36763/g.58911  ORF Transcript_36763/g.58911 Transcript_36763/m.58911 type:complete len:244 (+) Transcript_36763:181-912(+)
MFSFATNDQEYISLRENGEALRAKRKNQTFKFLFALFAFGAFLLWYFSHDQPASNQLNSNRLLVKPDKGYQNDVTVKARAEFVGEYGIEGYVEINAGGNVDINLNVAGIHVDEMTQVCGENNLEYVYHIHNEWRYDDLMTRWGAEACGESFTEAHYNPFNVPTCSELPYGEAITYYNCEVGDLSGRFGVAIPDLDDNILISGEIKDVDGSNLLHPEVVYRKSIVFHCANGVRLFCAPFSIALD